MPPAVRRLYWIPAVPSALMFVCIALYLVFAEDPSTLIGRFSRFVDGIGARWVYWAAPGGVLALFWGCLWKDGQIRKQALQAGGGLCPFCLYDLRGRDGEGRCPECGEPIDVDAARGWWLRYDEKRRGRKVALTRRHKN